MNFAFKPLEYFCYPETQGLSLEKIDNISARDVGHGFRGLTRDIYDTVVMTRGEHIAPPLCSGNEEEGKDTAHAMHQEMSI